ncbi:MAG: hypothetical protein ACLPSF_11800 [Methylocella sp.]
MTAADTDAAAREAGAGAPLEIMVRTDAARVAAFRAATVGAEFEAAAPAVPLTYPFCWMTSPEVRPMLERMIGEPGLLPIHEAQSFDYHRPLALDAGYRVAFTFARTTGPERLTVAATISTPGGERCAAFETVLRLVPRARLPGAADA